MCDSYDRVTSSLFPTEDKGQSRRTSASASTSDLASTSAHLPGSSNKTTKSTRDIKSTNKITLKTDFRSERPVSVTNIKQSIVMKERDESQVLVRGNKTRQTRREMRHQESKLTTGTVVKINSSFQFRPGVDTDLIRLMCDSYDRVMSSPIPTEIHQTTEDTGRSRRTSAAASTSHPASTSAHLPGSSIRTTKRTKDIQSTNKITTLTTDFRIERPVSVRNIKQSIVMQERGASQELERGNNTRQTEMRHQQSRVTTGTVVKIILTAFVLALVYCVA